MKDAEFAVEPIAAAAVTIAVAAIANDDVIEDVHAEQPSRVDQSSRKRHVVRARGRIAAWVVVRLMCSRSLCGGAQAPAPMARRNPPIADT